MDQAIKDIISTIEKAIGNFKNQVPHLQELMYDELQPLLKELKLKNGKMLNSLENLKLLAGVKNKLRKIIINDQYRAQVMDFINHFDTISDLNIKYFKGFNKEYTPSKTLPIIKQISIENTVNDLVGQGMEVNIVDDVAAVLNRNITTGGSYADMQNQLKVNIIGNDKVEGKLLRYTGQITVDAINQYHAQYHAAIAQDLNFNWGRYVGSLLTTSREFCVLLTEKQWVHKSELPGIIHGMINGTQCKLSNTTKLPLGMIPGTNAFNFKINRGGYLCGHHFYEVPDSAVPAYLKSKFPTAPTEAE